MVVICPSCKVRLKIDKEKHAAKVPVFKCPQCYKIFVFKKTVASPRKEINQSKILVAHSDPAVTHEIMSLLGQKGYQTVMSSDGIAAIINIIKELPFLTIIEEDLPKINGFEVRRRVKSKAEMKEAEFLFVISNDERHKELSPFSDANHFIMDNCISELLLEKIKEIL